MNDFFKSIYAYCKEAQLDSLWFWVVPIFTILLILVNDYFRIKDFCQTKKIENRILC